MHGRPRQYCPGAGSRAGALRTGLRHRVEDGWISWCKAADSRQFEIRQKDGARVAVSHELRTPLNSIIRFTVTDTGRGLRPEDMRHLFKPFRQINTGQSRPLS